VEGIIAVGIITVGLMLVGKHFDEPAIYRAAAFGQSGD
jgi:Asp-tRNA(Asn)/Glu-tRNA(Gln) amidotransferase A subunit family amidase